MTNSKVQMSNQTQSPIRSGTNYKKVYDLEERTALFGESIIVFVKTLPKDRITNNLVRQIIRSATSIGANYLPR